MSEEDGSAAGGGRTAAEVMLRSLRSYGIEHVFGNFGTDHPPFLEAAARVRETEPDAVPAFVVCPHETVALAAAHGYAAVTGEPQAVVVHVDVGTQNLGAMVHNAHRGDAPVLVFAGLAPVTHAGFAGSRDRGVHYVQDVYDQPGIVRQFCRWTGEYRTPADPDEYVARALEVSSTPRKGPSYLTATREALEATVDAEPGARSIEGHGPTGADAATVSELAELVGAAEAPLVVTSKLGADRPGASVAALVDFAEAAGAGVVESFAAALSFPRSHDLHAGFVPQPAFEPADLVLLVDSDVPWRPTPDTAPPEDLPVVHVDVDPNKPSFPQWDLRVDRAVRADPATTLAAIADELDPADGAAGRETWRAYHEALVADRAATLDAHRAAGRFTAAVATDVVNGHVDAATTVVNETTTSTLAVQRHLALDRPGSYFFSHGSGLGWAPGAAVGAKLGRPGDRVLSLVGDGSYVFGNPTATAWASGAHGAPTLTVVYNNRGWNAVRLATLRQHGDGSAAAVDVPESKFDPGFDLSHATHVVDAYSAVATSAGDLDDAMAAAVDAVDDGRPAVIDARVEPI